MNRFVVRVLAILACLCLTAVGAVLDARAESSVWVVKGPAATVYLAGSSHVLRASDHPLPAEFDLAYRQAGQIIFEAPPGDLETPEYLQKLMRVAALTDGTTLKNHLTPEVYAKAAAFCKEKNYPFEQYQLFRPWMLSMMLTLQEMARIGVNPDFGVDQHFYQKALADGKPTGGLETADEQIGFLATMDAGMGNAQVLETLDDLRDLDAKIEGILSAWRKGDEAGIEAFSLRELRNYPQLYSTLIVDRNKKWIPKIETHIRGSQNTMVIVGVAHLAGKDSVIDLLRKRGHQVEKLKR
ncbi:MAG: TraB/GumN family protein [Smithellaceae bacterium]